MLPIRLKKYLLDIINCPADSVVPEDVGHKVIRKMKLIKFAMTMLHP